MSAKQAGRLLIGLLVLGLLGASARAPALADHVPANASGPQTILADAPYPVNGTSGEWKWLANFPMGPGTEQPLGTDVETFVRDGKTHSIIGSMTLGFRLFRYDSLSLASKPTPLGDYASAFPCNEVATSVLLNLVHSDEEEDISDTLSVGGWQDDVAANGNGTLAFIATDADGRCHDRDSAGAEIVDISDLNRPRLFHLTGHFGESHTLTVDDRRGLIFINSSDTQANFLDIVDFRTCVPPSTSPSRFAACRPVVARYQFAVPHTANVDSSFKDPRYPEGLTAGTDTKANNGCHDVTIQGNFMYCAAINATVIFDISGVTQRNINPATRRGGSNCISLTDLSCRLTGTHLTSQTMINADTHASAAPPHEACPVEDGDSPPYNLKPASITNCEFWNRPTSGSQNSRYENDDFMKARIRNSNLSVISLIPHGGQNTAKPSDQDISISHEADPTEDGNLLIITDERGGGTTNTCTGASNGGGGAWFYDIRDKANPKVLKQPNSANGVFITNNAPVPGNCTIHIMQQVPGRNVIVAGWYIEGTHVFEFTPNLAAGQITFTELGHYIPAAPGGPPETWTSMPVALKEGILYIQTGDMTRGTDVLAFNLGTRGADCPPDDDDFDNDGLAGDVDLDDDGDLVADAVDPDDDDDGVFDDVDSDDDEDGIPDKNENDACPPRDDADFDNDGQENGEDNDDDNDGRPDSDDDDDDNDGRPDADDDDDDNDEIPDDIDDLSPIVAGASKVNIAPFTLTSQQQACRSDPACPYHSIVALSNPDASNPDGLPGGLFQQIGAEMAGPAASNNWVGPAGVWGEPFVDANGNGRYDAGETFSDDPANSSPAVGAGHPSTLGDPFSSSAKWDGVYIAGYGNDRVALGAFDPIWARVLFLRDSRTGTSLAWVSLDLLGYFSDFVGRIRARLPAALDVDHIILTHTHDHEAPDTHVGIWGEELFRDGTYPRYEIYIEAKIAEAITKAAVNSRAARFRFGSIRPGEPFVTPRGNFENLEGMIGRNSCRTPWFFDDELRVMQVTADSAGSGGRTIATLLNWGAHVESMNGRNKYVSSDFPASARAIVEQRLGGVAMYTPSAQGASEIVGDSCTRRWQRDTFDGETFPVDVGGDPLAFQDPYDNRLPRDRTYAIGRVIGAGALAALQGEPLEPRRPSFEFLGPRLLCFPVNNEGLAALAFLGVIDKPLANAECPTQAGHPPERAKTSLYGFRIGSASFVTAPGEVQPELYYGISRINRATFDPATPGYDYVSPNPAALECSARSHHGAAQPGAHTDRPFEPAMRDAQAARFGAKTNFIIGYSPDLLGYVVPGYDFYWLGGPGGFGLPVEQIDDPCRNLPPDLAFPDARFGSHYQETNSAGSMLASALACELARLLGDPLAEAGSDPLATGPRRACFEWDFANATGRPPDRVFAEPGCPAPSPDACLIRHY